MVRVLVVLQYACMWCVCGAIGIQVIIRTFSFPDISHHFGSLSSSPLLVLFSLPLFPLPLHPLHPSLSLFLIFLSLSLSHFSLFLPLSLPHHFIQLTPICAGCQDGVPVSDLSIPHLYEGDDPAEVTIQMASPEMSGTYTCVAENSAGTATKDTQFSVVGQCIYALLVLLTWLRISCVCDHILLISATRGVCQT